tara:strand:- start:137 stop:361 length:225 start_codon:yes stop_codon:yes gene_type:complete
MEDTKMQKCKQCFDAIEEWNASTPHPFFEHKSVCHFCQFEVDDDDKLIAKMEHNHEIGSPDKFLANKFRNYLNG